MSLVSLVQESGIKFTSPQFMGLLSVEGEGRRLLDRLGVAERELAPEHDRPADFAGPVVEWPAGAPGWVRDETEKMASTVAGSEGSFLAVVQADSIPSMIVFRAADDYATFLVGRDVVVGLQCTAEQVAELVAEYSEAAVVSTVEWSLGWHSGESAQILKKTDGGMAIGTTGGCRPPANAQELLAPLFV